MNFPAPRDSSDRLIARSCRSYQRGLVLRNAKVLDLGAHVGGFVDIVLAEPTATCTAVEPDPENLVKIVPRDRLTILPGAVGSDWGEAPLWKTKSKRRNCSGTIVPTRHTGQRVAACTVQVKPFWWLLTLTDFTHVKMDIEGAEYGVLDSIDSDLPATVKWLAIEWHNPRRYLAEYETRRVKLASFGWKPIREDLNYVRGNREIQFLGRTLRARNLWGLGTIFTR